MTEIEAALERLENARQLNEIIDATKAFARAVARELSAKKPAARRK